ncbi:MAG: N-acetylmuramoyl-L-alanine amidase [Rickettsiaceae bacterium H1]|nr:N-acetylmuramoyl-L-alanine amidase [Rickettsiaceae bacterium H1]
MESKIRIDYRSRNGLKPKLLVIHQTEGSSFDVDLDILQAVKYNTQASTVSAHYLISPSGKLAHLNFGLVSTDYSAYHAGLSSWRNILMEINDNSAKTLGFKSWEDYLKYRSENRDIESHYIHDISCDRAQSVGILKAEKLEYVKSGEKYSIDYAKNIYLENIERLLINAAYNIKLKNVKGITITQAKGLNDISIGIELTNLGDRIFSNEQIKTVIEVSVQILENNEINAFDIVGHAQIAPNRKQDPSGYFPWKEFYQGVCDKTQKSQLKSDLKKIITVLNRTCSDPNKVLLDKDSKDVEAIKTLQTNLKKYGYQYIEITDKYDNSLSDAVTTFNRHFCPEIFIKEKKEGSKIVLNPENARWYKLSQQRLAELLELL